MPETEALAVETPVHIPSAATAPKLDWGAIRADSLKPGGFGTRRVELWPRLLRIARHAGPHKSPASSSEPHRDERQIKLDTERSFVLYPVDNTTEGKEDLQTRLHELIVSLFRKRPRLNYFQGYHDIVTVLFLSLPPELQLPCAEKVSLHRVRDSMGSGLQPVLGLLRVIKHLIRLTDPSLASLLEQISPLPYYALSNLLTLFSHDMPSLPLIQHVFDYLFCRPPIFVVYLATAIILCRKAEIELLGEEGEEGMVHSLLSGLPDIYDDEGEPGEERADLGEDPTQCAPSIETSDEDIFLDDPVDIATDGETAISSDADPAPSEQTLPVDEENHSTKNSLKEESSPSIPSSVDPPSLPAEEVEEREGASEHQTLKNPSDARQTEDVDDVDNDDDSPPRPYRRPKVALSALLIAADELYQKYPPNHPDICLTSIMGPQSVVFTWSESKSEMPSDDEAERMVDKPELVVRQYVDPDIFKQEGESGEGQSETSSKRRKKQRRHRRRFGFMERRSVVAGAVVAVGVAVAVYGIKTKSPNGGILGKHGAWLGSALRSAGEHLFHNEIS